MAIGAVLVTAGVLALLSGSAAAQAPQNTVRIDPSGVAASPGGTVDVSVVAVPPADTLAAWVVELAFDPSVMRAESRDCDPFDIPGGAVGVAQCTIVDTNGDDLPDTAKVLGAIIFSRTEGGLESETALADITFDAVGTPGRCSSLRLRIIAFANSDGDETAPMLQDGQACVYGDAPPAGTAIPTEAVPRTPEPTPPVGQTAEPIPTVPGITGSPPGGTGATGTGQPGNDDSPAVSGSPADTGAASGTRTQSPSSSPGAGEKDDGGISTLVWLLIGALALALVGGGAWFYARSRRQAEGEPPDQTTPTGG